MALDGILLSRYVNSIALRLPLKINKIQQLSDSEVVFSCFSQQRVFLYVSTHAQTNRIQMIDQLPEKSNVSSNFLMLLKKHCEGGRIVNIKQIGFDRVVMLTIEGHDEMYENTHHTIAIELMGKYANMVLIDKNQIVIDALYRIPPYQNSKRILVPTAKYVMVDSLDKKSPLKREDSDGDDFLDLYEGFSPLLAREMEYRIRQGERYDDVIKQLLTSNTLYVAQEKPSVFHAIPLIHTNLTFDDHDLHKGMTQIYQDLDQKKRIKNITSDLEKIIRRELKKAIQKKEKLEKALEATEDAQMLRLYGDYCFTYADQIKKGSDQVTLTTFDQASTITILLDPRYSAIQNGQLYYKKYQKQVSSIPHIHKQIEAADQKIEYFAQLEDQLSYADVSDAIEIQQELMQSGYLYQKTSKKLNKKQKPAYMTIVLDKNTTIYLGKNNIQNDYVTFTLAKKKDTWFHVRHHHGAHVIVSSEKALEEKQIRAAAMLAAYYSKARYSSSVEVMYTPISHIKKIPNAPKGKVSVTHYRSIFIDPDEDIIKNILSTK